MIYLQILISIFVALVVAKLMQQRQRSKISNLSFATWLVLWLIVLIVFWQPSATSYLALWLGIGRGADLVVYVAIIALFYLQLKIFTKFNKIDSEITKLVRKEALRDDKER